MGMFNFVLDSFKGEIFDFKVKRRVLVASTVDVLLKINFQSAQLPPGLSPPHSDALTLSSVSENDSGTYQCVADNGFGQPALDSVNIRVKREKILYFYSK